MRWKTWRDSGEQRADAPGVAKEASSVVGVQLMDTHTHTQREPLETEKKEEEDDRRREEKTWLSRELNEVSKIK